MHQRMQYDTFVTAAPRSPPSTIGQRHRRPTHADEMDSGTYMQMTQSEPPRVRRAWNLSAQRRTVQCLGFANAKFCILLLSKISINIRHDGFAVRKALLMLGVVATKRCWGT